MTDPIDSRRRFLLRGRVSDAVAQRTPAPLRPPWALAEAQFVSTCTRCADCVPACPQGIVARGDGGYPEVRFDARECTFCGKCVEACLPGALKQSAHASPWDLVAEVGKGCLAHQGVECRVCGERCEVSAIRFRPALGGIAKPEIDIDRCTGCGACVAPCPVAAVAVRHR